MGVRGCETKAGKGETRNPGKGETGKGKRKGNPMTQIKLTLKCPQCSGTRFKAATAKPGPNDPVTCAQCGTIVDLAAEKRRLEKEASRAVEERLRDRSE